MCIFKKGEYIVLKTGANITTKSSTLLVDRKNNELKVFLNDYTLVIFT